MSLFGWFTLAPPLSAHHHHLPLRSKLLVPLPRTVDADKGRARWDAARKELSVVLPVARDELGAQMLC